MLHEQPASPRKPVRRVSISPPKIEPTSSLWFSALDELAKPFPSVKLSEWPFFNNATGGFRKNEFTILCGSTGSGKTTFLANVSAQLLKQQVKHFVMSVETGPVDFMKRVASVLEGKDLNTGQAVPAEFLKEVSERHKHLFLSEVIDFSLYEDRLPVEQLISDLTYVVEKRGCEIAMVDNLNFLLEVTRAQDAVIEMDRVVHELIMFCKRYPVHLIMVMHPRKTEGAQARVVSEFDIKGSSTSVQEAQNVLLFNRPDAEDVNEGLRSVFDRELKIQKMRRRGNYVGRTIVFQNHDTRYTERGFK